MRIIPVVVLVLVLLHSTTAFLGALQIQNDRRSYFLLEKFGFGVGGVFDVKFFDIKLTKNGEPTKGDRPFGVFVKISNTEYTTLSYDGNVCPLEGKGEDDVLIKAFQEGITSLTTTIDEERTGVFNIFFVNCNPGTEVSFMMELTQYNIVDGKHSYLSIGDTPLPILFGVFSGVYGLLLLLWIFRYLRGQGRMINKIHYLMTVLVVFKCLSLFFQSLEYTLIRDTGEPKGLNIVYYIFVFVKGVMLFVVILLMGSGWGLMKPFLNDNDKKIFFFVLPLQVIANIALIITEENLPGFASWITWLYVVRIIDIICCGAVLIPVIWSMNNLKSAAQVDGKARQALEKLSLFRRFYLMVISYIYFTRIVVVLVQSALPYTIIWVAAFLNEIGALAFYVAVAHQFRPAVDNPYFRVGGETTALELNELADEESLEGSTLHQREEKAATIAIPPLHDD